MRMCSYCVSLLGDTIVDANSGKVLGNKPLLTVTFDYAALKKENT